MIYLDNAATTQTADEVVAEMLPYLTTTYGNPGSIHSLGTEAKKAIDLARERVANAINAEPDEVIFTSGGSEANNFAVKLSSDFWGEQNIVLTSLLEHDSMKRASDYYAYNVKLLPYYADTGKLTDYIASDADYVNTLSFMYVNNELGILNPVKDICEIGDYHGNVTIVDAVQALGSEKIDVREIGCDFLTLSSHKIHGPKGIGALYIKKPFIELAGDRLESIIFGGDNQEFGLRGGTENVAGIVGFGKACEMINVDEHKTVISKLRRRFLDGLEFEHRVNMNTDDSSKIISITIPGIDAETLVIMLSSMGVCVSAGSACKSLEQTANEVLLGAHFTEDEARSTIRVSLSCYNTLDEMVDASKIMNDCISILKLEKGE